MSLISFKLFQVFEFIDLSTTYLSILCETFTTDYKGDTPVSEMKVPFLRALKTSKFAATPVCPYLELPNIITGLPAQCKPQNFLICYLLLKMNLHVMMYIFR